MIEFEKSQIYNYIHYDYEYKGYKMKIVVNEFPRIGYRMGDEGELFDVQVILYSDLPNFNTYQQCSELFVKQEQTMIQHLSELTIESYYKRKHEKT